MRVRLLVAMLALAACSRSGGITTPVKPKALDPWITIRVVDGLDTTATLGRTSWRVYSLLSGSTAGLNGVSPQSTFDMQGLRLGVKYMCVGAGADSIGQRLITVIAIGDTVHRTIPPAPFTDSIATRWNLGNHAAPPAGLVIFATPETDAWNSAQFLAGHGLLPVDPIKWSWDWSQTGVTTLTERAPSDTTRCNTE